MQHKTFRNKGQERAERFFPVGAAFSGLVLKNGCPEDEESKNEPKQTSRSNERHRQGEIPLADCGNAKACQSNVECTKQQIILPIPENQ